MTKQYTGSSFSFNKHDIILFSFFLFTLQGTLMFTIISPDQFKQIPWKNGKGTTTELAINDGGTLDNFNWRLSIASVVENGEFSDFSGYWRNLILLSGEGIELTHDTNKAKQLKTPLSVASFDGGSATSGKLVKNKISDFNLIHKIGCYKAIVTTYIETDKVTINSGDLCFVYAVDSTIEINEQKNNSHILLLKNHLLKINLPSVNHFTACGAMMIIITLIPISE